MTYNYLSQEQWKKVNQQFPTHSYEHGGRPPKDDELVVAALIYRLNHDVVWRDLPETFGPWQTIYGRFRLWKKQGIWEKIVITLLEERIVETPYPQTVVIHRGRKPQF